MKRPAYLIGAVVTSVVAFIFYLAMRPPGDVEALGDNASVTIAWISLAVAVLSLATAMVGLIQKLVELSASRRN